MTHHVWRRNGSVYVPKNTIPIVTFWVKCIMVWSCFSFHGANIIQKLSKGRWNHVLGNSWELLHYHENSVTIHQDNEYKMQDLPGGQQSTTYCKGESQLVPQEENKGVAMAQSITKLKPNTKCVEDEDSPVGSLESSSCKDCLCWRMAKIPHENCERLVSSY